MTPGAAKQILVVDDRPDVTGFMRAALERAGYRVAVAENGSRALALQRAHPADVLITDIFMPEGDGIETIDRVRAEFPGTRIIAMSGAVRGRQDYLSVAAQIGVDATLHKPFTVDELIRTLKTVL